MGLSSVLIPHRLHIGYKLRGLVLSSSHAYISLHERRLRTASSGVRLRGRAIPETTILLEVRVVVPTIICCIRVAMQRVTMIRAFGLRSFLRNLMSPIGFVG